VASYPASQPRKLLKVALTILAAWLVFAIVATVGLVIAFGTA